jgi:hypothetical protein
MSITKTNFRSAEITRLNGFLSKARSDIAAAAAEETALTSERTLAGRRMQDRTTSRLTFAQNTVLNNADATLKGIRRGLLTCSSSATKPRRC